MLDRLLTSFSDELRARTRVLCGGAPQRGLVLYWMRVAVRDHENPALDAAIAAANALGTSVFVYHAVSERYPYASDRHHTFILEGARDVALGLQRRGVAYALHVERPGARGPFLRSLAERAAIVVTEDAPVPPLAQWTSRLVAHLEARGVPLLAVDASCVVPMPLVKTRYDRAYAFRSASRRHAAASLARPWRDLEPTRAPVLPELPFPAVDAQALDDRAIARLVAECAIDHSVGPVRALRGGSRAGYARWDAFRAHGLARYAARRNDAAVDGTSRLSPWIHYGHVSPLRIAREVAALPPTPSIDKFLDELLVWREVAWHYAAHTPDLDSLGALPNWAIATLEAHASDPRETMSLERLERGRTGDRLWDAAQRSLVRDGELHNNLRMTWGKAIPFWTSSPEAARRSLIALNHRYALDGRDPASYGGLYWCLGLFDRPFTPEGPVLGSVRSRPTAVHAERLDLDAFAARGSRPPCGRVAVIGAGLAGLACARVLLDHGVPVVVFDKGRAAGGRLATLRSAESQHELVADLGAQYFTVRDERFDRFVRSWIEEGLVSIWRGRIGAMAARGGAISETAPQARFVGVPSMSALARHLGRDLDIRVSHRVDALERRGERFALAGTIGLAGTTLGPRDVGAEEPLSDFGEFDAVVVCVPASQAQSLLAPVSPRLANEVGRVRFDPCLACAFVPDDEALADVAFDGVFVGRDEDHDRVIAWIARDSSKPGREGESWVVHAAPAWSEAHLRDPREAIEAELLGEVARLFDRPRVLPKATALRRWAFARAPLPLDAQALFDDELRVGAGGDFCAGGRVEGAFLSGVALAGRVLGLT